MKAEDVLEVTETTNRRVLRINFQMSCEEKAIYRTIAREKGMNLSVYIRLVLAECPTIPSDYFEADRVDDMRTHRVNIQASTAEKAGYQGAADAYGVSLSTYIRTALLYHGEGAVL